MNKPNSAPLPTFLYIGTAKAGSSWIFEALREHPEVFVPDAKDLKYFDVYYGQRSFPQYQKYFREGSGYQAIGELSHDYFTSEVFAERIKEHLPDIKLIACLREPGALAISSYKYIRMLKKEADVGFAGFVDGYLAERGYIRYLANLRYFYKRFPKKNILVTFFDDLQSRPREFIGEIYDFIGVDPGFKPTVMNRRVNVASMPRFAFGSTQLGYSVVQLMRRLGLENLVGRLKANSRARSLLFRRDTSDDAVIDEEILRKLRAASAKTYKELEALIGRPLPEAWYHVN
jgi:hypothetical protein